MEIILVIAGAIVFIISFLLPEKRNKTGNQKIDEMQIKKLIEQEVQNSKGRIEEVTDETITYAVEKTERFLDRITNEKIMAVNEYSDTVLENIHKNHEEVMFLYDMLNNKHLELKQTIKEISKVTKEVREVKETAETKETVRQVDLTSKKAEKENGQPEKKAATFTPLHPEIIELEPKKKQGSSTTKTAGKKAKTTSKKTDNENASDLEVQFVAGQENISNSNEHILLLHKQGKSNMAIAKELGLGIGEVKLVIDLFEGM